MKEYWGEGSARARNWQRYDLGGDKKAVLRGGRGLLRALRRHASRTTWTSRCRKVQAPPCATAARSPFPELQEKAKLTLVSSTSIVEGGAHDVLLKDKTPYVSSSIH